MPNLCNNTLQLVHADPEQIAKIADAIEDEKLLSFVCPIPDDLNIVSGCLGAGTSEQAELEAKQKSNIEKYGYADWYGFCNEEWGTKWDIAESYISDQTETSLYVAFDTAWSPPLPIYKKLEELGFTVIAYYYESGFSDCGKYESGSSEFYHIDGNSDWVVENIPSDIDAEFAIAENMSFYESELELEQE